MSVFTETLSSEAASGGSTVPMDVGVMVGNGVTVACMYFTPRKSNKKASVRVSGERRGCGLGCNLLYLWIFERSSLYLGGWRLLETMVSLRDIASVTDGVDVVDCENVPLAMVWDGDKPRVISRLP
jgi:hypothetical protein